MREVAEQFSLQTSGIDLNDREKVRARHDAVDHPNTNSIEDKVNGNERQSNLERNYSPNGFMGTTYTKFFKEKDGTYTIETSVRRSNPFKVNKETKVTR